jgi:hypothetical protein
MALKTDLNKFYKYFGSTPHPKVQNIRMQIEVSSPNSTYTISSMIWTT